ncbi:hypothetical protein MFIFM68171_09652 [Madurella fahalii]|uniref:Endo-chitosanase n=1 Tax=Madurella fahalii TaxID=1157608 RepID=A0ABQ0GNX8_9PEZI
MGDDDGRCGNSEDTQFITSLQWIAEGYNKVINKLNAIAHPYVVFGNEGFKPGWTTFGPWEYGIEPLSLVAVVYGGDKLICGVWGDEPGDDGDRPIADEASILLVTACFGTGMNGNNGHDDDDLLCIAFHGSDAVRGADGADWGTYSYGDF